METLHLTLIKMNDVTPTWYCGASQKFKRALVISHNFLQQLHIIALSRLNPNLIQEMNSSSGDFSSKSKENNQNLKTQKY